MKRANKPKIKSVDRMAWAAASIDGYIESDRMPLRTRAEVRRNIAVRTCPELYRPVRVRVRITPVAGRGKR